MELKEKLLELFKEHAIAMVFGLIGLICLGYGFFSLSPPQQTSDSQFQNFPNPSGSIKSPISPVQKQITIDIEGSVQKPGVYKLPADSRIQDALIASGGLSQNADRQQVAQNLNLAAPLTDGAKLYIPVVGEQMKGSEGMSNGSSGNAEGSSTGTVNINQATESELDALPGVGPVTAQKIISNRPYSNVQGLLDKKVVGQSVFSKIKDQVSVY